VRVLVTGAGGFIGSRLVPRLEDAHEVIRFAADLRRPFSIEQRVEAVVHLAQSRAYRDPAAAADVLAVNASGTSRLLEEAERAGTRLFVLASTGSVYRPQERPLTEHDPVGGDGAYVKSKLAAEEALHKHAGAFATVVLRFFTVYGPRQHGMVVAELLERVRSGKHVRVDRLRLSPTYVDDAVRAIEASLAIDGHEVVNVAGDESVTLRELAEAVARAEGVAALIEEGEIGRSLVGANARMRSVLGVAPEWTLERGLAATVAAREP